VAQRVVLPEDMPWTPDVRLCWKSATTAPRPFEELVLRYESRLVRVLEHVVGSRDLAEDLTQEVFLRVYRSRKQYVPGAKFATWLFTIANNAALNALRNRSRVTRSIWPLPRATAARWAPARWTESSPPAAARCRPGNSTRRKARQMVRVAMESLASGNGWPCCSASSKA